MNLLLDTNRYCDFCRGRAEVVDSLQRADRVCLPFVCLAELRAGFHCGAHGRSNERVLTQFLNRPRASVLYADEQTTHHYARLFHQLRAQGNPIPTNDIWIAALAIQHDMYLLTRDRHFDALPQIPRV
ncbi:MAG: Ribonuclease VapC1 [Verrucomicrobia bacterium ADurb.Bin345]|nr:MAG: Ribonuclease VapC1 [Verrucomicrobia bacterium ADurb.Bin345]